MQIEEVTVRGRSGCPREKAGKKASFVQRLPVAGLEGDDLNTRVVVAVRYSGGRAKQDRTAPRENLRPTVRHFARVQLGHRDGCPAGRGDPRQDSNVIQGRDDIAVVPPASAKTEPRVAQRDRRAAFHRDLLQLAFGEESDPVARRRKERRVRILGPGERCELALMQEAGMEARLAVGAAQRDGQAGSV